ncbi:MAG: hypothetical protein P4L53_27835 [Candidatus Obscuribacterales bacterium]|nr:hypothetical protein [Candidatus Obscuribacterales bacterium]
MTVELLAQDQVQNQLVAPSTVGDVIGQSFRLCRSQIKFLARIQLMPTIIELLGNLLIVVGAHNIASGDTSHIWQSLAILMPGLFLRLLGEFFLTMRHMAVIRWFTGFSSNYKDAYDFVWTRKFYLVFAVTAIYMMLTASVVFWCVVMGVSLVFVKVKALAIVAAIGAIGSVAAMFASLLICTLPLILIAPAIACESTDFTTVMGEGLKLTFSNLFRTLFFGGLLIVTVYVIAAALDSVPIVVTLVEYARAIIYGGAKGLPKTINLYTQIFSSVWRSASNMFVSPLVFVACGLFYADVRMRVDGLDLSTALNKLKSD